MRNRRHSLGVNDPQILIANALVNLDPTSIVTSGSNVTGWNNIGRGGSAYDLDVIVGTAANLTSTTVNGYPAVATVGSAGLKSSSGVTIGAPLTIMIVAAMTGDYSVARTLLDDYGPIVGPDRVILFVSGTTGDAAFFGAGGNFSIPSQPVGTATRVWTGQKNNDATSKLTVSGLGSATGNIGANAYEYGSMFIASDDASSPWIGNCSQRLIWDYALSENQIQAVQTFLKAKFAAA